MANSRHTNFVSAVICELSNGFGRTDVIRPSNTAAHIFVRHDTPTANDSRLTITTIGGATN